MNKIYLIQRTFMATVLLIVSSSVSAGLSFVVTDTATRTEAFNIEGFATLSIGSSLSVGHLDVTGPGSQMISYTFLGQESGYNNKFYDVSSGNALFESDPIGTSVSSLVNISGPLSFKFEGNVEKFAVNGGPWDKGTSIGLIGTNMQVGSTVYDFVIGYNDSAGQKYLGDWDDFVIGVSAVPEPETYAMLLVGLGLIGFLLRNQSRSV